MRNYLFYVIFGSLCLQGFIFAVSIRQEMAEDARIESALIKDQIQSDIDRDQVEFSERAVRSSHRPPESLALHDSEAGFPEQPLPAQETEQSPIRVVSYRVRAGDTLTSIWRNNGGDPQGGLKAAQAFKAAGVRLSSLRAGEELELTVNDQAGIVGLRKALSPEKELQLTGDGQQGYIYKLHEIPIEEQERTAFGTIETSFSAAAVEAQVPYQIIDDLVDLFSGRLSFRRDMHRGDTFALTYIERRTVDGLLIEPGALKAASIFTGGELLAAVRFEDSKGEARYFDENGELLGSYFLRYPLRFTRISSVFNKSRFHPVLKQRIPHNGVDFAAPTGTPVRSVADGVIVSAGYNGPAGKMVKVRHDSRYSTAYLHLSSIPRGIKAGVRVKRGQTIGAVGMTGRATGPHLHFSLYDRGVYVDPLKVKLPRLQVLEDQTIPVGLLRAALKELKSYHQNLKMATVGAIPVGLMDGDVNAATTRTQLS